MTGFSSIDLSKLPIPEVIETPDFEVLFDQMKAEAIALMPSLAPYLDLESEPVTQLLRVCAYYRMLDRLEFNDGARANMLALSTGTNLDGLAAFWGVERLIVQAADDSVDPPIQQILESDEAFRTRIQLSLEGHTTAGTRGSYIFWGLSADGDVKDVSVESPNPGEVLVTVLSNTGDGTAPAPLLETVEAALNADDVRPLTDFLTVQSASIVTFNVTAVLTLYEGMDEATILENSEAALAAYLSQTHRLGYDVTVSGLHSALHQEGVQNVSLVEPSGDIVIDHSQAAYCAPGNMNVSVGGEDV